MIDYSSISIGQFREKEDLLCIFRQYAPFSDKEEDTVNQIIQFFGNHTLLVELIAKQTHAIYTTPKKMLEQLYLHGVSTIDKNRINIVKDAEVTNTVIADHIARIFSINEMTKKQMTVLFSTIFMPVEGVSVDDFMKFWSISGTNEINCLEKRGWIQLTKTNKYYISIHPAIARAIVEQVRTEAVFQLFILGFLGIIRSGYDDHSVRADNWEKVQDKYVEHGFNDEILKYSKENYLKRIDVPYAVYVGMCDSIAQKIIEFSIIDEYSFVVVYNYCNLFMKYGNNQRKLKLMECFYEHPDFKENFAPGYGAYVDLLLNTRCVDHAMDICNERIKYYSNDSIKQLIWFIRLTQAALMKGDMKLYIHNYAKSRYIYWILDFFMRKEQRKASEYGKKIEGVLKEALPRLAEIFEENSCSMVRTKNKQRQDDFNRKYLEKAIKYRSKIERGVFRPTDNYLKLELDKAKLHSMSEDYVLAKHDLQKIKNEYIREEYNDILCMFSVYELLGSLCMSLEQHDEAEQYLIKAIEISTRLVVCNDYNARCMLGSLYVDRDRNQEGEKILQVLLDDLRFSPNTSKRLLGDIYYLLGESEIKKKEWGKAIEFFKDAQDAYSKVHSAYFFFQCPCYEKLADISFENQSYAEAVQYMQTAINIIKADRKNRVSIPPEYIEKINKYKSFQ